MTPLMRYLWESLHTLDFLLRQAMQAVLTQRLLEPPRSAAMVPKNGNRWVARNQRLCFGLEHAAHASRLNHRLTIQLQMGVIPRVAMSSTRKDAQAASFTNAPR